MKIYDISQEIFSCEVYLGDPRPECKLLSSIEAGDIYNLSAFSMCAHNGTHIDAPSHFINGADTVSDIDLNKIIGYAYVAKGEGEITAIDAERIIQKAKKSSEEAAKRILLGGKITVTNEAAKIFAESGIFLIGNESQSVGPENAPMAAHLELLSRGVVILEGIRLSEVPEGVYMLFAAPLNLGGFDGAPCRAILVDME